MNADGLSPAQARRRALLVRLLAAGAFALPVARTGAAPLGRLGAGRSIYLLNGDVRVDGAAANLETVVAPGALVETGADGRVIFAVGDDAFTLRANSRLQLESDDGAVVEVLRLVTGRLLSVFGRRAHRMHTSTATIGIRGTGVYAESEAERSYVCTCYGVTEISPSDAPEITETVDSTHHDDPRWVYAGRGAAAIEPAPFVNHTDEELLLIESLVGREPPFAIDPSYDRPRPRSY